MVRALAGDSTITRCFPLLVGIQIELCEVKMGGLGFAGGTDRLEKAASIQRRAQQGETTEILLPLFLPPLESHLDPLIQGEIRFLLRRSRYTV